MEEKTLFFDNDVEFFDVASRFGVKRKRIVIAI